MVSSEDASCEERERRGQGVSQKKGEKYSKKDTIIFTHMCVHIYVQYMERERERE